MLQKISSFLVALGPWGILLLAFLDSAGIPVAVGVDALVLFLAVKSPEMAVWNVAVAVAGSTVGNIFLYFVARKGGEAYLRKHREGEKTRRFDAWFHHYGLLTVFVPAVIPIPMPMKPFVILSGVFRINQLYFVATVVIARIIRYGGEAWLGVRLGKDAGAFLKAHRWEMAAIAAALFASLYLIAKYAVPPPQSEAAADRMGEP